MGLDEKLPAQFPEGRLVDDDRLRWRLALDAGGEVRRRTHDGVDRAAVAGNLTNDDSACRDADATAQCRSGFDLEAADLVDDGQTGRDCALDLVLMRVRPAEIDEHAVAQQPHRMAAEPDHRFPHGVVVALDDGADLFGIESARHVRRADKVAEHDGEAPSLGGDARGGGRRRGVGIAFRQGRDGAHQALPISQRQSQADQIGFGQMKRDIEIDIIGPEKLDLLTEADRLQPRFKLSHREDILYRAGAKRYHRCQALESPGGETRLANRSVVKAPGTCAEHACRGDDGTRPRAALPTLSQATGWRTACRRLGAGARGAADFG
jgi:hypothetical protein